MIKSNETEHIELAVAVLREVVKARSEEQRRSAGVRLALGVLSPHCQQRLPIAQFWEALDNPHAASGVRSVGALYEGILHQLERSGAWSGTRSSRT